MINTNVLYLPLGDSTPNKVTSSFTLHKDYFKCIEPAGRVFEEMVKLKFMDPFFEEIVKEDEEENVIQEEDLFEYEWEKEYKSQQKNNKDGFSTNKENFYQILGIDDLFLNAKQEDIRKAYKKLAVLYHPDKNKENISLDGVTTSIEDDLNLNNGNNDTNGNEEGKEQLTEEERKKKEINQKWLKIKEAYDTLLDPEKRKKYDSTIEFDDTIPDDDVEYGEKEFFKVFGPVFLKNSIWSKKKPVPKIGDLSTPIDKVRRFYRFWYNFQSWRDFSVEGEYNLEEAGSRYEKRQMLKENKKMKSNLIKEEKARLDKLVQLAYKHDPRIKAEEEKERKQREEERKERLLARQKQKEEEEQRKIELQKQHEEKLKRQQELKAQEKEMLSKEIINLGKRINIQLTSEEIFLLNLNSNIDKLKDVITQCSKCNNELDKKKTYVTLCKSYFAMKLKCDVVDKEQGSNSMWTKEEIILLQKAVKKFPAGTKNRYEKIKEIVTTKSNDDIIQMTHYLLTNPNIKIDGDINLNQIMRKEKQQQQQQQQQKDNDSDNKKQSNNNNNVNNTNTNSGSSSVWTAEEQKMLENALRKYPSSMPANERWTNIAKEVTGKTKKQCVERYKYLASLVKKNK